MEITFAEFTVQGQILIDADADDSEIAELDGQILQ